MRQQSGTFAAGTLQKRRVRFSRAAHTYFMRNSLRREPTMKPLWRQTLAWIAAVVTAVLLAWANPDGMGFSTGEAYRPHGGMAPR
jgi:hypothetical protein